ncbi:MAG: TIGR03084 family metal-binding protein [Ancrocorticia sp.]|nr:TIGR03084 family metal-binding protein [Ancrocorticia sp.]MCI1896645.1 TIGR03084 family metal-binding protein [Ancrocorticia sp.]MCI1933285.1 TIGR03084 family metal-binding protein [Ancrocorticia sp.]MCI1963132.1 TIGR03084 family metal-binding protein [Ancrocorticia sp.]MCI2001500.1 TIGR03084 family metal-binding protein [Ancrocorticia sp.]
MKAIVTDLIAEQACVDTLVADFTPKDWDRPAAHTQWTFKDTLLHIAAFDYAAIQMMLGTAENVQVFADPFFHHNEIHQVMRFRDLPGAEVLNRWRRIRSRMDVMMLDKNPKDRVPWAPGLPMAARSLASARLMELWAHSLDITDALGIDPPVYDRISATLFLSWQARPNAYHINGFDMPETPIYLEVTLPSGTVWAKGDPNAENRITGSAKQWAQVAVRRRNWMDTSLEVHGAEARRYASIVQAFAGEAAACPPAHNPR